VPEGSEVFVAGGTGYIGRPLVRAVENPPDGVRIVEVPDIRRRET
jgi:nucleoside-diphosphate-sugar epimerase